MPPYEDVDLRELPDKQMPPLQVALLHRSIGEGALESERCGHCRRTLLVGEQAYVCGPDRVVCELCVGFERDFPRESRLVHGPEFGHTIRVLDQRVAV